MCCFGVRLGPVAEPLDGPWASRVREIAAAAGITVVAGMFTPAADGRVHNTLLATGGGVEAGYDKIHLFDAFGFAESDTVAPGTEPVTIERRRAHGRPGHLLRPALPRPVPAARRPRGAAGRGARVVGRRSGQARAVGPAGPGPRAGLDHLRGRLRPGRPDHGRPGPGQGADRDRGQRGGRPARGVRRPARRGARPAAWSTSTSARWTPPARWSRCWPTAASRTPHIPAGAGTACRGVCAVRIRCVRCPSPRRRPGPGRVSTLRRAPRSSPWPAPAGRSPGSARTRSAAASPGQRPHRDPAELRRPAAAAPG